MRIFARLSLILTLAVLAVGPVLAAPIALAHGPSIAATAPGSMHTFASVVGWLAGGALAFGITIRSDTATLANKFVTRAQAAAPDYKTGVQNAGGDWETNTKNAEANYEQGVQQSIADKRFGRGVAGSGGKYQANAVALGTQRYAPGVANAKDAWQRGVQPALDTLKSLNLPPKGPRRSPQNQARSAAVSLALGNLKTGK